MHLPFTSSPTTRDAAIIFGLALVLLAVFIGAEAFEYVVDFSHRHEHLEIDEGLTVLMVMPIAMGIFAWRRLAEARTELARRIEAEEKAHALARHDPLTGLPNRRHAEHEIGRALEKATPDAPVAVLLVDVNRFKSINDLYGHAAGDRLLLDTGERLRETGGPDALVARLGGDEFVVLLQGPTRQDELIHRVETISESFARPFVFDHGSSLVGASIGVTLVDRPGLTPEQVLARADAAMYRCKGKGLNGFAFFEEGMEFAAFRRAQIERDLRQALAEERIEPFFQPLVSLTEGCINGYEVLARWRLQDGTLRLPDEFIPIAEDCGLIGEIYFAMLRRAAARPWPPATRLAINLSPIQFEDDTLVERTRQVLEETGFPPGQLDIEITESAFVSNLERARIVIAQFKELGIQMALDDFGTGYSSLRHLSEFHFDKLKIDRSFITDLADNPASQTIVRTITAMAHNLGLRVTVEGVESIENEADLLGFGCDVGQGYLYGHPAPQPETRLLPRSTGQAA
ncbi:putative bifunctional diguanylate cyclase/phosphodiesterase [Novosphingobium mangrovi (ex Hu et al. 2023)]|uniref:EAL domain-containing protein n=1 Tax=Novosphingobium mangrovi (ex Hu et al. 2023) TaxID=2930094 RepID=A0ABT0AG18_9SPHN|nr:EAL domain-containing protein [Novosphingobium mangrovi (ex Hu et al. 2023)]MCJ1962158.1 EAL domain-containing protein [Novosphingobium mangrovi (ex Hu et al. 2023)]